MNNINDSLFPQVGLDKQMEMCRQKPSAASAGYAPVELDLCAQCGADPAVHCKAGHYRGREPHNLDGSWMQCGACGNTITVIGRQAVKRVRAAWNIRA